jgi:hypothetical protein
MNTYEIVTERVINLLERGLFRGADRGPQAYCRETS